MILKRLALQNFRSYTQKVFSFDSNITYIVGPNTTGKSNLIEAIYLLSSGKSYRAEKDTQLMQFGEKIARVKSVIGDEDGEIQLEVVLAKEENLTALPGEENYLLKKKYFVNGVPRSRLKFSWNLKSLLFVPSDLDIIDGSPSLRRRFLDDVLELTDEEYRRNSIEYTKALRQRNALLEQTRETGIRNEKQYEYWDELVIKTGSYIAQCREQFIAYINDEKKDISSVQVTYDHSLISKERLEQYKHAEVGSAVTLVGPHRDDFSVHLFDKARQTTHNVKYFGSRGQQRLAILQLKLLQIAYVEKKLGERPLLLLDDIFSELDEGHIALVMDMVAKQQTIITTTHKEFLTNSATENAAVIELSHKANETI